jgi:glycosyltransferase involved in cell wall biosynthesis
VRVCLVFDCLYPHTVGGAERWYRNLAERLAARGARVSYLTLLQWDPRVGAGVPNVEVVAVGPRMKLYVHGRRSVGAQVRFSLGVFRHLVLHGGRYDVVQTPALHLSLLAVVAAHMLRRFTIVVDWFEIWTREYWLEYLGRLVGTVGWTVQRISARTRHNALCFSYLHARRLEQLGYSRQITILEGLYPGDEDAKEPMPPEPIVVFAGRLIPEKQATAIVPAVAHARKRIPALRAEIFGDGPERGEVLRLIDEYGLGEAIQAPGFVESDRIQEAVRRALCLVFPSRREGYGLVVVEAAALGTPTIVIRAPDNAAVELITEGENGLIAASAEPEELGEAILRVHASGSTLRRSTVDWFKQNRQRLSLENSVERVLAAYRRR